MATFPCLVVCVCVAAPPTATVQTPPAPEQLVRELGSPRFTVRERATDALWRLGEKARPALNAALRSDDPEVRDRAHQVLTRFDAGIFPDTPADVRKHIDEFRSGNLESQKKAVTAMVRIGATAAPTLRALLTSSVTPGSRAVVFEHLASVLRREVPRMLLAGKEDDAETVLALAALGSAHASLLDYTVFVRQRGRVNEVIARLEATRAAGGEAGDIAARVLVFAYRAAGDGKKATSTARTLLAAQDTPDTRGVQPNRRIYESLLEDLGAWSVLADQPILQANSEPGLRAFRLRLAGRNFEADALLHDQTEAGPAAVSTYRGSPVDDPTLALMANGRALDGIARLRTFHNAPHVLADVLSARLEFRAALDLLAADTQLDDATGLDVAYLRQLYGTRRGRLLAQLGQRDEAAKVFEKVAGQVTPGNTYAITQLVRYEVRSGRADSACEHLGTYLAAVARNEGRLFPSAGGQDSFEVLFDVDADAARYWWETLYAHRADGESPGKVMRRVRELLAGKSTQADLDRALTAAGPPGPSTAPEAKAMAVAAALRANGKTTDAITELTRYADQLGPPSDDPDDADDDRPNSAASRSWVFGIDERFRFWVELGDLLTEQGKHAEAASRFEQGWQWYPDNPVLLYLSGKARVAAGDTKEGMRRLDLAHWVGLGNARIRGRFLEELIDRGDTAAVRRERDLVREAGWVADNYLGNVWNQVARASLVLKDYPAAADAHRRAIHYLLRTPSVSYVEGYAYLTVPQSVRSSEARGLIAAGKVEEGLAVVRECLTVMPGNSDLAIGVVPDLEKLGRKADADAVFRRVWDAYNGVLKDHPESAWAMASAAWLAAGCRRELDQAVRFAEKAVEWEPSTRGNRETLAEVHFRRGERAKATAIMADLVAGNRHSHHYKRQLERYRTAAFDSPLPGTEE